MTITWVRCKHLVRPYSRSHDQLGNSWVRLALAWVGGVELRWGQRKHADGLWTVDWSEGGYAYFTTLSERGTRVSARVKDWAGREWNATLTDREAYRLGKRFEVMSEVSEGWVKVDKRDAFKILAES